MSPATVMYFRSGLHAEQLGCCEIKKRIGDANQEGNATKRPTGGKGKLHNAVPDGRPIAFTLLLLLQTTAHIFCCGPLGSCEKMLMWFIGAGSFTFWYSKVLFAVRPDAKSVPVEIGNS